MKRVFLSIIALILVGCGDSYMAPATPKVDNVDELRKWAESKGLTWSVTRNENPDGGIFYCAETWTDRSPLTGFKSNFNVQCSQDSPDQAAYRILHQPPPVKQKVAVVAGSKDGI